MGIREAFEERGLTIYKVSKDTGIPYTTLNDLANGRTDMANASVRTLSRLSAYLGLSMDEAYRQFARRDFHLIKYPNLPKELEESIDALIKAVDAGDELIDCELSQVLGDINMSESWGLIDSIRAKELRSYYVFDTLDELRKGEG